MTVPIAPSCADALDGASSQQSCASGAEVGSRTGRDRIETHRGEEKLFREIMTDGLVPDGFVMRGARGALHPSAQTAHLWRTNRAPGISSRVGRTHSSRTR